MPPKKTRARRKTSSPSLPSLDSGVGLEFLARYLADREEGREQELSVYLKMFPGAEEEVRREYERVTNVSEGAAGFENFQQWLAGTELEQELQVQDYSVSNRGLKSGLVGTPEQLVERLRAFEAAGVDLVLLQFSPQYEEMERFSESVIVRYDA